MAVTVDLHRDLAAYVYTYLEKENFHKTLQAFVLECPVFQSTCGILRPSISLEKMVEEYRLLKLTDSQLEAQGDRLLVGLCDKLETIVSQIKCIATVAPHRRYKMEQDQRTRSRSANLNAARKRSVALHQPAATPSPGPSLQGLCDAQSVTLVPVYFSQEPAMATLASSTASETTDLQLLHEKSPRRKGGHPKKKEHLTSVLVAPSPLKGTGLSVLDTSEDLVLSKTGADSDPLQGMFLETLLETPSLQETLANIINKGRGLDDVSEAIGTSADVTGESDMNPDAFEQENKVLPTDAAALAGIVESDPAFQNLFSILGLDQPSLEKTADIESAPEKRNSSDPMRHLTINYPVAAQSTLPRQQQQQQQQQHNKPTVCTVQLKKAAVKRLDFGPQATVGTTNAKSIRRRWKRPTPSATSSKDNDDQNDPEKKSKTKEYFPENLDVDSFLSSLHYSQ